MCNLRRLKVDEKETFENIIVEHKVDIEISHIGAYILLASNKCKAFAQFHDELLQMADYVSFKVRLSEIGVLR